MSSPWLHALTQIAGVGSSEGLRCPSCGNGKLDFQYVGDQTDRIGFLCVWCVKCLKGVRISRVKVPSHSDPISYDDSAQIRERIPNFVELPLH